MSIIERSWDKTSSAMRAAIELASKLGYSRDNLLAANTIIPVAYFIYKNGFEGQILHSAHREIDRKSIREWLARVLLKGTFGGQPDSIYPVMRNLINKHAAKFPLQEIIAYYKGRTKSISFTEDDIDSLMSLQYGKAKTYCALTLLYPALNYNFKYHQDHIHPKSFFTKRKLKELGITEAQVDSYTEEFNCLANLQLLQASQNIEKSDKPFVNWLDASYPVKAGRDSFLMQNHIKPDESLVFTDFLDFIENRKLALKNQLRTILDVSTDPAMVVEE